LLSLIALCRYFFERWVYACVRAFCSNFGYPYGEAWVGKLKNAQKVWAGDVN